MKSAFLTISLAYSLEISVVIIFILSNSIPIFLKCSVRAVLNYDETINDEEFSLDKIRQMKALHPQAKTVVHPECPAAIIEEADYVGSTAGILEYCGKSEASDFIVVTEAGIITEMQKRYPQKRFIPAPAVHEAKCNECHYMKMVNLENILECMEKEAPEIILDEDTRQAAEKAIKNMVAVR
jgi:quinolinate synthase